MSWDKRWCCLEHYRVSCSPFSVAEGPRHSQSCRCRDPYARVADVLARIADLPVQKLDELLPWSWHARHRREAV